LNKPYCLIDQPIGLGDIFFLQAVAKKYRDMGYEIIWPVRNDVLSWIPEYISDISFCSINSDFPGKNHYRQDCIHVYENFVYLGLNRAHVWFPKKNETIMSAKYSVVNMSWNEWHDGFQFNRNHIREKEIYYDVLGLEDDSEYVLKNDMCGIDIRRTEKLKDLKFSIPVVDLKVVSGYTLFDWCKVFENAKEIHTVHTGICYILDKLTLKNPQYHMYQGLHDSDVQYIPFRKKPVWVGGRG
jgi:hypothetical protein